MAHGRMNVSTWVRQYGCMVCDGDMGAGGQLCDDLRSMWNKSKHECTSNQATA